jgi:hypothetical protein
MWTQTVQPLIWLARRFTSSIVAVGSPVLFAAAPSAISGCVAAPTTKAGWGMRADIGVSCHLVLCASVTLLTDAGRRR